MIDPTTPNHELPGLNETKKRGRPSTGKAMTAAQRQAKKRRADQRAASDAIGHEETASLKALLAILARADKSDDAKHCAGRAWKEIGRRYGFFSDELLM